MPSGLSDVMESGLMLLIFNNVNWANVGDATGLRGSTVAGSLYAGLHTAALNDASTQVTSQAAYGAYTRVGIARSGAGWTCSANQASNTAAATFPTATSGSETESYFSVGLQSGTGAGDILWWGSLTNTLAVSNGIAPSFAAGALICLLD